VIARTSSSTWVRGVIQMFEAEGVATAALLQACGFDAARLADPAGRFTIDEISSLWAAAVARSGKTTLGLSKALAGTYGKLGVVGYAMMACPTLQVALQRLQRSMDVVSNAATFVLTDDARGCWFELGHLGGELPIPRQRSEYGMLTMLSFCSWISGHDITPLAIEFVYPEPPDDQVHRAVFGCPLRFNASANRALLCEADLARPLPAHDPHIAALHQQLVEQELQRLEGAATAHRVRHLLATRLSGPEPRREQVAAALKLSDRTLQRRLKAEGTSFQQLLDDTRREWAQHYLRKPHASIKQVAGQLGFEDTSNFFRACKPSMTASPGSRRAMCTWWHQTPRRLRATRPGWPRCWSTATRTAAPSTAS